MALSRLQRRLIASIVAVGLAATGAVLVVDRPSGGTHASHHGHDDHDDHDDHARDEGRDGHADHDRHARDGRSPPQGDTRGTPGSAPAGPDHDPDHHHDHDHAVAARPADATHAGARAGADGPRVPLTDAQVQAVGIATATAGPQRLQATHAFPGEVRFNDDRTAHVVPRLAGVAEAVPAHLGQSVRKGELLAVIASTALADQRSEWLTAQRRREAARVTLEREQRLWAQRISAEQDLHAAQAAYDEADIAWRNAAQKLAAVGARPATEGLNRFEVRAPFDGTVVDKHLTLGEAVKEDSGIFTVSDLRSVWAEFAVAPKDLAVVRVGQRVRVSTTAFDSTAEGTISYVGALLGEQTRTARARVTLANPDGAWRPGLFVTVSVFGPPQEVPVAVPAAAVQSVDNVPTVFRAEAGGFVAVPVELGAGDGTHVEVRRGLRAGDAVATANAFVLKSELGKKSAQHTH